MHKPGPGSGARDANSNPRTCLASPSPPPQKPPCSQLPSARLKPRNTGLRVIHVLRHWSLAPGTGGSRHHATRRPAPATRPWRARREGGVSIGLPSQAALRGCFQTGLLRLEDSPCWKLSPRDRPRELRAAAGMTAPGPGSNFKTGQPCAALRMAMGEAGPVPTVRAS